RGGSLVAHAIGAGLFAAGIAWSAFRSLAGLVRRRRSTSAWLDDVLLLGFAGGVALFALLTDPKLQAVNARYLLPPLVFGAVLTARRAIEVTARIPAPALAAAGLALGAAYLTTPLATVRAPPPANPAVAVADWLEARDVGPYRVLVWDRALGVAPPP